VYANANLGGGDGLVGQSMRCKVSNDLCFVAHDAGRSDPEKIIGVDPTKRERVGGDLRVNPLPVLLLNRPCGARRSRWPCALVLRNGTRGSRQHERSDDPRWLHWHLQQDLVRSAGSTIVRPQQRSNCPTFVPHKNPLLVRIERACDVILDRPSTP